MKVALFGSTGPTGRALIPVALRAGHRVVAYARSPEKLAAAPGLELVRGGLEDNAAIAWAVAGCDAVISLLGPSSVRHTGRPISDGTRRIIAAMQLAGVKRLMAVSTPSAGDPGDGSIAELKLVVEALSPLIGGSYEDLAATADAIRSSDRDWTLVRVGLLRDGDADDASWLEASATASGRRSVISRTELARFVVAQLEDATWIRGAPFVSRPSRNRAYS